jgi:hypothetical protein
LSLLALSGGVVQGPATADAAPAPSFYWGSGTTTNFLHGVIPGRTAYLSGVNLTPGADYAVSVQGGVPNATTVTAGSDGKIVSQIVVDVVIACSTPVTATVSEVSDPSSTWTLSQATTPCQFLLAPVRQRIGGTFSSRVGGFAAGE